MKANLLSLEGAAAALAARNAASDPVAKIDEAPPSTQAGDLYLEKPAGEAATVVPQQAAIGPAVISVLEESPLNWANQKFNTFYAGLVAAYANRTDEIRIVASMAGINEATVFYGTDPHVLQDVFHQASNAMIARTLAELLVADIARSAAPTSKHEDLTMDKDLEAVLAIYPLPWTDPNMQHLLQYLADRVGDQHDVLKELAAKFDIKEPFIDWSLSTRPIMYDLLHNASNAMRAGEFAQAALAAAASVSAP